MSRLFDVYIAVDWSARNKPSPPKPSPDSVWFGEHVAPALADDPSLPETYWRTRSSCRQFLHDRLRHHTALGRRVLVGFDFAYGYPAGFASSLGLPDDARPWRRMWDELARLIEDNPDNSNNRFDVAAALNARCGETKPGPLWGCPVRFSSPTLETKSPAVGFPYPAGHGITIERLRWVENRYLGCIPSGNCSGLVPSAVSLS